ncbi:hypothetical protein HDU96_003904, partial [Phlyctochytrium bullatum]
MTMATTALPLRTGLWMMGVKGGDGEAGGRFQYKIAVEDVFNEIDVAADANGFRVGVV